MPLPTFTIVHVGPAPSVCIHCHGEFYRPTDKTEPWVDADHCPCGRNDDGTPKTYTDEGMDLNESV